MVPSNREPQLLEFLDAWKGKGGWDNVIVVEDNSERTFRLPTGVDHFSHAEIDADLGEHGWIISRRDSAIRSYGFLKAYQMGADRIITLDDDVRPVGSGYCNSLVGDYEASLEHPVWVESVPGRRTRGLPYVNRGTLRNVVIGAGLWANVADDDSLCALVNNPGYFAPPAGARIIPRGQLAPVCGMSLYFKREATPLCFFPLMGEGQPYRRFDDIWFGATAKHVLDHLGWHLSIGGPVVEHIRASDKFKNLVAEAPGIAANERYWEIVTSVKLTKTTPAGCAKELGEGLQESDDPYVRKWGRALDIWGDLFGGNR